MICVAHAHIDMNWMWRWDETVAITLDTFRTMLDLIACDAEVTRLVFGPDGQPLDLGRTERVFKGSLRRDAIYVLVA